MVHDPDWTSQKRINYTKRLFDQLAYLLPEKINGGISSSPISYKLWFKDNDDKNKALIKGAENMLEIVLKHRDSISIEQIMPRVRWNK